MEQFSRMELLLSKKSLEKLYSSHIAVFGLGGVGSYVIEALSRCGIGKFTLIDNDIIELSNINRQIIATFDTIGKNKVDVAKDRILSINPKSSISIFKEFYPGNKKIDFTLFDYVVDAIDIVSSKLILIEECKALNIPIISAMGTGNKLDPTKLTITDIFKTSICPLCKVVRHELKNRNIDSLKVIYSSEEPIKTCTAKQGAPQVKRKIGSIAFVPATAGLLIASEVIKDLTTNIS